MKTLLAKILTGGAGIIVTPLLAKGIAMLVAWLASFSPESAAAIDQAALLEWLNGLIVAVIMYFVIKPERAVTKAIQVEVNNALPASQQTPEDGISHKDTKRAVLDVIRRRT